MSSEPEREATALRQAMVDMLVQAGNIRSQPVEAAIRAVPRHHFLPEVSLKTAYADQAVPTKYLEGFAVSAASQPTMVAIMLEGLALAPGQRVLEIGAGTGYNAALMAHIVGASGQIVTVDIDEDIVVGARTHLAAAGFAGVQVVWGDGALGYAPLAPYDRIILTVGAADIEPAWRDQLAPSGRLLVPLSIAGGVQKVIALEPAGDHLRSTFMSECRFMPLRGSAGGQEQEQWLNGNPALILRQGAQPRASPERVYAWLVDAMDATAAGRTTPIGQDYPGVIRLTPAELTMGLLPWLDLRQPGFCTLRAGGETAVEGMLPPLFSGGSGESAWRMSSGLCDETGLCLLYCPPPRTLSPDHLYEPPFDLTLRSYGQDGPLQRTLDAIESWRQAARPSTERMRLRVYPRDVSYMPAARETALDRAASRLVLEWQFTGPAGT
ncbi:MAG TPA: methyltransferase domain-containing protein [Chloroflexota bacterium]|nr:methyltransferase domain-containing protein [Chloroflexota bacterium]